MVHVCKNIYLLLLSEDYKGPYFPLRSKIRNVVSVTCPQGDWNNGLRGGFRKRPSEREQTDWEEYTGNEQRTRFPRDLLKDNSADTKRQMDVNGNPEYFRQGCVSFISRWSCTASKQWREYWWDFISINSLALVKENSILLLKVWLLKCSYPQMAIVVLW